MTTLQELPPDVPVDLTNCDREPIHIPGSVQPHGLFLALEGHELRVAEISESSLAHVGAAPDALLGRRLDELLDEASVALVRSALAAPDPRAISPVRLTAREARGGRRFDGILHHAPASEGQAGLAILELEPAASDAEISFAEFYRRVRGAVARLQRARRVVEMCQLAADEIAALTGFDRVMAYRFDRDDHGHVIAEVKREDLEPFLDLHYPASDIPAQARRLYTANWLRLIADVGYRPSRIVSAKPGPPLDLSFAVLRSVSPIHVEYLTNMGVRASMSVSLVVDGRLWGLLICHHYAPRFVPYEVRAACEFLGQALSWQLSARERSDALEHRAETQARLTTLVDQLAASADVSAALIQAPSTLLGLVDAAGVAVRVAGAWQVLGQAPPPGDLTMLAGALAPRLEDGLFATDSLVRLVPTARSFDGVASGVLALALTARKDDDVILWFRPEVVQTVSWAGDPHKLASLADGDARLTPRGSFALWRETVRSRSLPWQPWELDAAADLRRVVVGNVLRRNIELADRNAQLEAKVSERTAALTDVSESLTRHGEELTRSNAELERFAYVASHDLQEPLRMVVSYVQLLAKRYQGKLDSDADEFIGFAVDGAKRMQLLINDLLAYSRIGRQNRPLGPVDLGEVLDQVLANLGMAIAETHAEITRDPLPEVQGDRSELNQVLQNLISNAVKFRKDGAVPHVHIGATRSQGSWTITVKDDGIGIAPQYLERIFIVFQRLHTRAEFPGSGVGLAITKKIIERHGGRLWVESAAGAGSTFLFTLPERKSEASS